MNSSWWDYRVVKDTVTIPESGNKILDFSIREIYYDPDGSIRFWSDPLPPAGETIDELYAEVSRMFTAFGKSVIEQEELDQIHLQ